PCPVAGSYRLLSRRCEAPMPPPPPPPPPPPQRPTSRAAAASGPDPASTTSAASAASAKSPAGPAPFDPRSLTDFQLDELTHRLTGRITRLLRTELRLDRERIGRLRDPRH
ncbi:extensin, partial [Streptomyces mangrovi]